MAGQSFDTDLAVPAQRPPSRGQRLSLPQLYLDLPHCHRGCGHVQQVPVRRSRGGRGHAKGIRTEHLRGMGRNRGFRQKTCQRCFIRTCSLALVGATRGEVLVADIPMSPCSRAMSVYHWQMPKWFDLLAVTHPTPDDFALDMACFILKNMIRVLPR